MRKIILVALMFFVLVPFFSTNAKEGKREFYSLVIYRVKDNVQLNAVEKYLKDAYVPALHRLGKKNIGVFKPVASDTAAFGKIIYVLTPFQSLEEFNKITSTLSSDVQLAKDGAAFLNAQFNEPPYERKETVLMTAFTKMPMMEIPKLMGVRGERVYELRSYESATDNLYTSKVKMFNDGDEIGLFKRLQFNAVFYAEVLAGGRMPNLIYMTTFENRMARDAHWKSFVEDPQWKTLSGMAEYQHTVSKADILLLYPTDYSDY